MKIRFIGDVHGKYNRYKDVIRDTPKSIQVGDMGVGFISLKNGEISYQANPPYDNMSKGDHKFIRGNHDNPEACKGQAFWIPDGTLTEDGVFCVGGATSVDKIWRTEGFDWWADEELSDEELEKIIQKYSEAKPELVCTHECPESIANEIIATYNMTKIKDLSRTRLALERMFAIHQPKFWVFGHWHKTIAFQRNKTVFQCLNELDFIDKEI